MALLRANSDASHRRAASAARLISLVGLLLAGGGCLRAWDVGGPWKCGEGNVCPEGFTCDDQVCCVPGGTPACPTLPAPNGTCPDGPSTVYFQDQDRDGYGNTSLFRRFCRAPTQREGDVTWVDKPDDCDDNDAAIHPNAPEQCNGRDDSCDQRIDEGLGGPTFFRDEDSDGAGAGAGLQACVAPPGYVPSGGDCAPNDPSKFPAAPELCNNLDDDCDGNPDTGEMTFADTDVTGTSRFPCVSAGQGVCRAGTFRCEPQGGAVQRVCVPLQSPTREVCDGLDNDCNGAVDEAPKCGGPRSLISAAGVTYRALRLSSGGALTTTCQANLAGTPMTVSSDGRTWSGTGTSATPYHVWSAQAPAGTAWDLSKLDLKLHLKFGASVQTPYTGAGGNWGLPPGAGFNPVIYLCGDTDTDFIRYRITTPSFAFKENDTAFDQDLPLNNSSTVWLVGTGSGFDTSRVRRIEVLLFVQATDFTITFDGATGFVP